jgi:hypothetical protein
MEILKKFIILSDNYQFPFLWYVLWITVELHLAGRWLSGSAIIRNGLALRVNVSRILQN